MQTINILRHYKIIYTKFQNKIYHDDPTWIAEWFFNNSLTDNVTFEIQGNMHNTFPNPEHLSVRVIYENGYTSEWLHLSKDAHGNGYRQHLATGNKLKKNIKVKRTLRVKKNKL